MKNYSTLGLGSTGALKGFSVFGLLVVLAFSLFGNLDRANAVVYEFNLVVSVTRNTVPEHAVALAQSKGLDSRLSEVAIGALLNVNVFIEMGPVTLARNAPAVLIGDNNAGTNWKVSDSIGDLTVRMFGHPYILENTGDMLRFGYLAYESYYDIGFSYDLETGNGVFSLSPQEFYNWEGVITGDIVSVSVNGSEVPDVHSTMTALMVSLLGLGVIGMRRRKLPVS